MQSFLKQKVVQALFSASILMDPSPRPIDISFPQMLTILLTESSGGTERDSVQQDDFDTLLRSPATLSSTDLMNSRPVAELTNIEISSEIVLTLKAYLDEAERDLANKKWENVIVYLDTVADQEAAFSDLITNLYPGGTAFLSSSSISATETEDNSDVITQEEAIGVGKAAQEMMEFEAKTLFETLDQLREGRPSLSLTVAH
jgi:hypothetical protein